MKFCVLLTFLLIAPLASAVEPSLGAVDLNTDRVTQFGKIEMSFVASGDWRNPFDPAEVAIDCVIQPPSGPALTVPAYFDQDYDQQIKDGNEMLAPRGEPKWKVRYTPTTVGDYRYRLKMTNTGKTLESKPGTFHCVAGTAAGFIHTSSANPHYLQYDNGRSFFAVGEDVLCSDRSGSKAMDRWLNLLAAQGANFIRTWWCYSQIDLESSQSSELGRNAGWYDLRSAWRADRQVETCERLGMAVMPTLETQQYLRKGLWWEKFTYNAANGGPVRQPGDYFRDETAAKLFRDRLRYVVARWSYSPAIFSWMFWNEVDSCNDYNAEAVGAWHRQMGRYLASIDPNHHLINSNFGNLDGRPEVDDLPEMNLVATNLYTRHDSAASALWASQFMSARRPKPYLLTEFGLGHNDRWAKNDPTGIALHDGLWGCAFGGAAGGAMVWDWDEWVDAQNLYPEFAPFARFMKSVPFASHTWKPIHADEVAYAEGKHDPYYASVFIEGFSTNYQFNTVPTPRPEEFQIDAQGRADRPDCFSGALSPLGAGESAVGSAARNDAAVATRGSSCTLDFTMPRAGEIILHVPRLEGEQHPILEAVVDGQVRFHKELSRDDPKATWDYFGQFPLALKAGMHRVTVRNIKPSTADNFWRDRVTVAYEITHYRERHGPNLEVAGLVSDDNALIWLRNPAHTWLFARLGRKPEVQPAGHLHLYDLKDGTYAVEWMNTYTGHALLAEKVTVRGGEVVLSTPAVDRSAAARMTRQ